MKKYILILCVLFVMLLPACANSPAQDNSTKGETEMIITFNNHSYTAKLVKNSSTEALIEMLKPGPVTVNMEDYAGMEKVGPLPKSLPQNNKQMNTSAGDVILYQGNRFVIYYGTNSWSLTPLGKIEDVTSEDLRNTLGSGDVVVTLSLKINLAYQFFYVGRA